MAKWIFEPGHTGAEFRVRHMMVSWVRGKVSDVHGFVEFDPRDPQKMSVEANIDIHKLWTGEAARDKHLKSPDFFDAKKHPAATFKGNKVELVSANEFRLTGDLNLRGKTKPLTLDCRYFGHWQTPYWDETGDKGPVQRAGFSASCVLNRNDFGISWNDNLDKSGVVVGAAVWVELDVEAILESDLTRIAKAA